MEPKKKRGLKKKEVAPQIFLQTELMIERLIEIIKEPARKAGLPKNYSRTEQAMCNIKEAISAELQYLPKSTRLAIEQTLRVVTVLLRCATSDVLQETTRRSEHPDPKSFLAKMGREQEPQYGGRDEYG